MNFLLKPILFLPFQAGYPAGLLRGIISTSLMAATFMFLLAFSLTTVMHLFLYRYLIVKRQDDFPFIYKILMSIPYLWCILIGVQQYRAHIDDRIVIEGLKKVRS